MSEYVAQRRISIPQINRGLGYLIINQQVVEMVLLDRITDFKHN